MRQSLLLLPVLLMSCAHSHRPPRPPQDVGGGQLMYVQWGRNPVKIERKLTALAERHCNSQGAAMTADRLVPVVPGRFNETQLLFHCTPIAPGPAGPAGAPPPPPTTRQNADAAQEDLEDEEAK